MFLVLPYVVAGVCGVLAVRHCHTAASVRSKLVVVAVMAWAAGQIVRIPVGPFGVMAALVGVGLYVEFSRILLPKPA